MEHLVSKKRKKNDHNKIEVKQIKCEYSKEGYGLQAKAKKNPIDPPPKVLKEKRGLVTNLINESYGVATLPLEDIGNVGVIFDTCEFWHNGAVLVDKGLSLQEVIEVGDWIKFNAVMIVEGGGDERNILYLATAIMKIGHSDEQLWDLTAVKYLSDVPNQKIENSYAVLTYLSALPISIFEREMIEKSKTSFVTNGKTIDTKGDLNNFISFSAKNGIGQDYFKNDIEQEYFRNGIGQNQFKNGIGQDYFKNDIEQDYFGNGIGQNQFKNGIGQDYMKNEIKQDYFKNGIGHFPSTLKTPKPNVRDNKKPHIQPKKLKRLLQFQEKLVKEKGFPKSHLQTKMAVTPGPDEPPQLVSSKCTSFSVQQCNSNENLHKSNSPKPSKQSTSLATQKCTSLATQKCTSIGNHQNSSEPSQQRASCIALTSSKSLQQCTTPKPSADRPQVSSVEGFPPGFGILEGFLVKLLGVSDFLDCVSCLRTMSMQVDQKCLPFYQTHLQTMSMQVDQTCLPFYQTHFKSPEHKQKAINSNFHKALIQRYLGQRAIGKALILQESARLGLEPLYACDDLELFKCNYCPKLGVTMWHFINKKDSPEHNKDFRLHCQNFLDGVCTRSVCQFKHYSKEFVLDSGQDPGFLPQDILRITSSYLNEHPVTKLRQRQTSLGLELPVFKKNNEVDGDGFTRRFCHVSLSLGHGNEDDRRIFFGRGSSNREAKENAAIAALAALQIRKPADPCPHGKSQLVGCWCLGAKSVYQH